MQKVISKLNKGKNDGFTLVEVMVVTSILGLVASVALANLQGAREQARIAAGQQFHGSVARSLGADTVVKFNFDEGAGSDVFDESGNNLDGTIFGATHTPDGMFGSALLFDGNDYIQGDDFPILGDDDNLTISVWLYPTNIAVGGGVIFTQGDISNPNNPACTNVQISIPGGIVTSTSKGLNEATPVQILPSGDTRTLVNNQWQLLTIEYTANNVTSYINGIPTNDNSLPYEIANLGSTNCPYTTWRIGQGFTGIMDELSIYNANLAGQTNN
jgi:prepilin-type N-terminal cleavage/methylation domain-containing protein